MAGAPIKKGLDYLQLDVGINQDPKVELLEAEFGLKGFAFYIKLLIRIYENEGYFMRWNKDTQLLLAKRVGEPGSFVGEVVNGAVRRGLFDESVFDNFGVLTSSAIQKRYFSAIKRRERVSVTAEYLLIDINEYSNSITVDINSINEHKKGQSRVEKSRAEQSRAETDTREGKPRGKCSLEGFESTRGHPLSFDDVKEWMGDNGISIPDSEFSYEIDRFRDKFSEKRYKDWVRTFRNYLRSRYLDPEHFDFKQPQSNGTGYEKGTTGHARSVADRFQKTQAN